MTFPLDSLDAVTSPDPHETYDRLRNKGAMLWSEHRRTWMATTDGAVRSVLSHPAAVVRPPGEPVPLALAGTAAGDIFAKLVRMNDGDRQRSGKAAIERAVRSIPLDRVRAESRRQAEAMEAIALDDIVFALPVRVVGRLLGISAQRLEHLPVLVRDFARCIGPAASDASVTPGVAAAVELSSWIGDLLPGAAPPDLLGCLHDAFVDVGAADPETVVANTIGLLFQAYDATAGLLASTLRAYVASMSAPGPGPETDAVMRRVLIDDGPIQNTRRFASADITVCGQHVSAGDPILLLLASASRDPHALRPGDLSLGSGPHACPGGEMAKAIVSAAVPVLIDRGFRGRPSDRDAYLASPNARIPLLEGMSLCCAAAQEGHAP